MKLKIKPLGETTTVAGGAFDPGLPQRSLFPEPVRPKVLKVKRKKKDGNQQSV